MHEMPGQHGSLKSRKRKSSSEVKSSRKVSAARRYMKSSKTHSATASSSSVSGDSKAAATLSSHSRISCECHQATSRRRCSASPELEGPEGKENEMRTGLALDSCRLNSTQEKQEHEEMHYEETSKDVFPDDDSNQILPVEQFFGNLDIVQDFPEGSSATSASVQRKHRRRHYYAREDSDEEEVDLISTQQDDTGSI
ncbi:UPF0688 protein C1orf174 homolog [Paralichthys olivaceus]|uniref:UPF0688 protein C1orf174 homolog n=1 Tax=Paralichthys olivaceus TaxID=8255 RepID=UPI00097DB7C3|nr:PREDICTED: UPF0688 protein C1orf174 homolog [Paralichthys olivaceus]